MTMRSSKTYSNFPCAHRQWRHEGNCALVHGYSRSFTFWFECEQRDKCGFVVDFGDLKWLKSWLEAKFDHTLLICDNDPLRGLFETLEARRACKLVLPPYGVGMEDTAQWLCEYADNELRARTKGRAWVYSVESRENDKNSAIYINPEAGFKGWS